jgi:hypothetical protein
MRQMQKRTARIRRHTFEPAGQKIESEKTPFVQKMLQKDRVRTLKNFNPQIQNCQFNLSDNI